MSAEVVKQSSVLMVVSKSNPDNLIKSVEHVASKLSYNFLKVEHENFYDELEKNYNGQDFIIGVSKTSDRERKKVFVFEGRGDLGKKIVEAFNENEIDAHISEDAECAEPNVMKWLEKVDNIHSNVDMCHIEFGKANSDNIIQALDSIFEIEENEIDVELVNKAYDYIYTLVKSTFTKTMLDVGNYLIMNFYDNSWKNVHNNNPTKGNTLNQLITKITAGDDDAPSKAWLYNSVLVAADHKFFEEIGFGRYKELSISQQVQLTRLKDTGLKQQLALEAINNNLS